MASHASSLLTISTRDVPPAERLSFGSWLVSSALIPSSISADSPLDYELDLIALDLPEVTVVEQGGSPQRAIRSRPEIRRTGQHCFNLVLVSAGAWRVEHMGRTCYGPGDLIFYDSRYPLDCDMSTRWGAINLQLSHAFVRKWLPNPAWLGGRRIARETGWGRVLASYVSQWSPRFVAQAPLPQGVLVDQLGALLALTASELSGGPPDPVPSALSLRDRVHDMIRQRCAEASLEAGDVASSLGIAKRTLHRALAGGGETFVASLIEARVELATRMLHSPLFDRFTTAEIGRRAGFSDASHFARVMRARTGHTPLQLRKSRR